MKNDETTARRYCQYCGSRLMVDVMEVSGKAVIRVKCTKCKRQNIIEENS